MICPSCQADNDDTADICFRCGKGLFALTEGSVLGGRYEIVRPLGKGGMGMVYKAFDREFEEAVAIKVLRDFSSSSDAAKRFRSEGKLARKVSHRNVCRIHEYARDGHRSYIVMELVEGEDFKRLLRDGPLPPQEAYQVAIQVAQALEAIHEAGIVHRDLKTPNIMRDASGVVKLMDFGIAKSYESGTTGATATGHVIGTPEYMSPEQSRGEKVDARSDIYALGIVTFELFTGDVPFRGETPVVTLFKHIQDPPPLHGPEAARLPRPIVPLLERALAKSRDARYATAGEMAEALKRARDASFGPAPPTPTPIRVAAIRAEPETEAMTTPVPTPTPMPQPAAAPPPEPTAAQAAAPPRTHASVPATAAVDASVVVTPAAAAPPRPAAPPAPPPRVATPPRPAAYAPRPRAAQPSRVGWGLAGASAVSLIVVASVVLLLWSRTPGRQSDTAAGTPSSVPIAVPKDAPPPPAREPAIAKPTAEAAPIPTAAVTPTPKLSPAARTQSPAAAVSPTPRMSTSMAAGRAATTPAAATPLPTPLPAPASTLEPPPPSAPSTTLPRPAVAPAPLTLPQLAPSPGVLSVTAKPWALVMVDGKAIGKTPVRSVSLPPGEHVVLFNHPDYEPLRRVVQIGPGAKFALTVDLRDEALKRKK